MDQFRIAHRLSQANDYDAVTCTIQPSLDQKQCETSKVLGFALLVASWRQVLVLFLNSLLVVAYWGAYVRLGKVSSKTDASGKSETETYLRKKELVAFTKQATQFIFAARKAFLLLWNVSLRAGNFACLQRQACAGSHQGWIPIRTYRRRHLKSWDRSMYAVFE